MLARLAERKKLIDTGLTPDEATKISTEADTDITESVLAQYLTEDDEIILQNLKSEESDTQKQKDKLLKKAELEAQKLIRREKLDSSEGKIRNTFNVIFNITVFSYLVKIFLNLLHWNKSQGSATGRATRRNLNF